MPRDAFISHSTKDATIVNKILEYLETNKIPCWMAPRDISPGENFAKAIIDGIKETSIFILVFSKNSNLSDQVLKEIDRAVFFKKKIIVFEIENVKKIDEMEYYLCNVDHIEMENQQMKEAIHLLIGWCRTKLKEINSSNLTRELNMEALIKKDTSISKKKNKKKSYKQKNNNHGVKYFIFAICCLFIVLFKDYDFSKFKSRPKIKSKSSKVSEFDISIARKKIISPSHFYNMDLKELERIENRIKNHDGMVFERVGNKVVKISLNQFENNNLAQIQYFKNRVNKKKYLAKKGDIFSLYLNLKDSRDDIEKIYAWYLLKEIEHILLKERRVEVIGLKRYKDHLVADKDIINIFKYNQDSQYIEISIIISNSNFVKISYSQLLNPNYKKNEAYNFAKYISSHLRGDGYKNFKVNDLTLANNVYRNVSTVKIVLSLDKSLSDNGKTSLLKKVAISISKALKNYKTRDI